jgi:hypothetical protein
MRKVRYGLGVVETPVPRFILVTAAIANGIGEIVAKVGSVRAKPSKCGGLFELHFKRAAAGS